MISQKGCDASNAFDEEANEEWFSDDEKEKQSKSKQKNKRKHPKNKESGDGQRDSDLEEGEIRERAEGRYSENKRGRYSMDRRGGAAGRGRGFYARGRGSEGRAPATISQYNPIVAPANSNPLAFNPAAATPSSFPNQMQF